MEIRQERYEVEEDIKRNILSLVRGLSSLVKEDYEEIEDPQEVDKFIDDLIYEMIKILKDSGYSLPDDIHEIIP